MSPLLEFRIRQVRRFDRLYDRRLRERDDNALVYELSIAEMRVFYELGTANGEGTTAWLISRVRLDSGYLCRILKKLSAHGWLTSRQAAGDRRHRIFQLTNRGREVFESLERFHDDQVRTMLEKLPERHQASLVQAMRTIEAILTRDPMDLLIDDVLRRHRRTWRRYAR